MQPYNVDAPSGRFLIDAVDLFPESQSGNRYLAVSMFHLVARSNCYIKSGSTICLSTSYQPLHKFGVNNVKYWELQELELHHYILSQIVLLNITTELFKILCVWTSNQLGKMHKVILLTYRSAIKEVTGMTSSSY